MMECAKEGQIDKTERASLEFESSASDPEFSGPACWPWQETSIVAGGLT